MPVDNWLESLFGQLGEAGPIVGGFIIILGAGIIGAFLNIDLSGVQIVVGILVVLYIICVFGKEWSD